MIAVGLAMIAAGVAVAALNGRMELALQRHQLLLMLIELAAFMSVMGGILVTLEGFK